MVKACCKLKELCGSGLLGLKRFGDFNLEDQECPGRPSTTDEDQIKILIENNPRYTTRKLAKMLNIKIHYEHFVKLGYINRFDV